MVNNKIDIEDNNIKITIDNEIYNKNKNYLKNFLIYIKVSNLFIIGFYKSVIHTIYPYWYKEDIKDIVIKLQSILLKKKT
tara:strand:- start:1109 stop:1348 length:240 start_codon:yes stop_codon:yes gene_type:complete